MLLAVARPALALLDPQDRAVALSNAAYAAVYEAGRCIYCDSRVITVTEDQMHEAIRAGRAIGPTAEFLDEIQSEAGEHGEDEICDPYGPL